MVRNNKRRGSHRLTFPLCGFRNAQFNNNHRSKNTDAERCVAPRRINWAETTQNAEVHGNKAHKTKSKEYNRKEEGELCPKVRFSLCSTGLHSPHFLFLASALGFKHSVCTSLQLPKDSGSRPIICHRLAQLYPTANGHQHVHVLLGCRG